MRDMPGIMSQMPPLPLSIDDDLANSILPSTSQVTHYCFSILFPIILYFDHLSPLSPLVVNALSQMVSPNFPVSDHSSDYRVVNCYM